MPSTGAVRSLQLAALRGLDRVLPVSAGLALGLGKVGEQRLSVFRRGLRALLAQRCERLGDFIATLMLHQQLVLLLHHLLLGLEIEELRAELVVQQGLADVALPPQQRQRRLNLGDGGHDFAALRLLLRNLAVEGGELGILLRRLRLHLVPGGGNKTGIGARGWREAGRVARQQCGEACDVQAILQEVVGNVLFVRLGGCRIELHQHLAGLHRLAVMHMDRADDAGLEGLQHLGAAGGDDLARSRRDDVDGAETRPDERHHEEQGNGAGDGAAHRRGRGLHDLQRRRQELKLGAAPARRPRQGNDGGGLRRLHGDPPAGDEGWRSGRRC